jgi:hypothetical protein
VVAASFSDDLVIGLVLGFLFGLLAGPALRSWVSWREWLSASRDADRAAREDDLIAEILELMAVDDRSPGRSGAPGDSAGSTGNGRTFQERWQRQR